MQISWDYWSQGFEFTHLILVPSFNPFSFCLATARTYLKPLPQRIGTGSPGVGLAGLVKAGIVRMPSKSIYAPSLESTGGCDLFVRDEVGFHAQWLRATCHVEIHCNTMVDRHKWKGNGHMQQTLHISPIKKTDAPKAPLHQWLSTIQRTLFRVNFYESLRPHHIVCFLQRIQKHFPWHIQT